MLVRKFMCILRISMPIIYIILCFSVRAIVPIVPSLLMSFKSKSEFGSPSSGRLRSGGLGLSTGSFYGCSLVDAYWRITIVA